MEVNRWTVPPYPDRTSALFKLSHNNDITLNIIIEFAAFK